MATKKQILESNELLQQKRKAYHLSDEGFEEYKKFLSDPDQKKFVTEYQINGKKYAGEIWATSWEEAECFIKQRASTEKAVGFIPKD